MGNNRYFDLNVFDEQVKVSEEISGKIMLSNPHFSRTLTRDQIELINSPYLKRINLAHLKWKQVCEESNNGLITFFRNAGEAEFQEGCYSGGLQPFRAGKFWQMFDYLDGNIHLRKKEGNPKQDRKSYQERLMNNCFIDDKFGLLQTGLDLAINSALLCDLMQAPRNNGSIYLFENIVNDRGSLFYPSVTNEFQKRVVNESFWQSLFDSYQMKHTDVLEEILTNQYEKLDPSSANESILRWGKSKIVSATPNPSIVYGSESFWGISQRAVENYGTFMNQVLWKYSGDREDLKPFAQAYVEAVKAADQNGVKYFQRDEVKRLLKIPFLEELKMAS